MLTFWLPLQARCKKGPSGLQSGDGGSHDRGSGPNGDAVCQVLVATPANLPVPGAGASVVAPGDQFWNRRWVLLLAWASKARSLAHTGTLGAI